MENIIYKITIKGCDRFYIGSAVNLHKRRIHHMAQLKRGAHRNQYMQSIYQEYGADSFSFTILEQVESPDVLLEAEQKWIDKCDFSTLINICPIAGNTLGRVHSAEARRKISENHADVSGENNPMYGRSGELSPNYGKKHREETRRKISEALKGKESWCKGKKRPEHSEKMKGENNPFYGNSHTEDTKKRISDSRKKKLLSRGGQKLTMAIAKEIRMRYNNSNETITSLAKQYNISRTYCGLVIKGVYWNDERTSEE